MTLLPKHPIARVAALLWLLACLIFLLLALLQPKMYADERSALAMLVPVYFLAFPTGHVALLAVNKLKLHWYLSTGFSPDIPTECILLWTFIVLLGYLQWFVLLPWLARISLRCIRAISEKIQ